MNLRVYKIPFCTWLAALLGMHPSRPTEPKPTKQKSRPRHRHSAFLELP